MKLSQDVGRRPALSSLFDSQNSRIRDLNQYDMELREDQRSSLRGLSQFSDNLEKSNEILCLNCNQMINSNQLGIHMILNHPDINQNQYTFSANSSTNVIEQLNNKVKQVIVSNNYSRFMEQMTRFQSHCMEPDSPNIKIYKFKEQSIIKEQYIRQNTFQRILLNNSSQSLPQPQNLQYSRLQSLQKKKFQISNVSLNLQNSQNKIRKIKQRQLQMEGKMEFNPDFCNLIFC